MKKATLLLPLLLLFPLLSSCMYETDMLEPSKSIEDAYALQRVSVYQHAISDPIIGYKAGLTSEQGQDAFDVDEPITGALFLSGLSRERGAYILRNYQDLRMEVELGFVLKKPIRQPITKDQLSEYIIAMMPVVELPNIRFSNPDNITGPSLVTSNVASNEFIIGKPRPYDATIIDNFQASLFKNGVKVNQGKATDAMGSQTDALVWMINRLLTSGYSLEQNHLLITGALGTMLRAEKGQYEAHFGTDLSDLNNTSVIVFSIR